MHNYGTLIAASNNDAYNALVCTDVGSEFGRDRVFQIGRHERSEGESDLPASLGGRSLMKSGPSLEVLELRMARGWEIRCVEFGEETAHLHEKAEPVALIRQGQLTVFSTGKNPEPRKDDKLIVFAPGGEGTSEEDAEAA